MDSTLSDAVTPVVNITNLRFSWPNARQATLDIPEFSILEGEHVFIKGPSGCGKSTLLGLLTGINQVQQGRVDVLGTEIRALSPSLRDKFRADNIGYIFQQFNLLPYLSVIENVTLPCQFSSRRKQQLQQSMQQEAKDLLSRLHLPQDLLDKPVIELSIGQQQRVAAARALIGSPKLIIADEPTSALDHDNRTAFIELLLEQANLANSTLVFVSHDPTLEALFDRSINLKQLNKAGESQ
ncbi:ABC transporter ATP-binding protein [Vibrio genomosp. F10]|uniref:Methionine ABC transporter ATP-binding protein n=5 Tax=Vibrio genomosp. F10 TaxID=723171 RepID=A0A1B9R0C3_9VIBR|nr:ABC transporter ATP-binding protein [Vibrio genomosp. F10]OCH77195.1 methionine ABC transporter ATP-binding protein [Vibrio genomosp. F10]OEE37630.1 methionine ABC transporter ATP-binding protein [Vibrio genomosp. F10 str. ZF-129]OEF05207.1 methionine ABC transporter ATP-binding protein [Vibrio genomosp. F10 str. 9ZB36]